MRRRDRWLCMLCSFVPAAAVWLSYQRYDEFLSTFQDLLCFDRAFTWRTSFVLGTIHFWPYLVFLGWFLLAPAMLSKPWAQRLRTILIWAFLVLGPCLYAVCIDGLYDPTLKVAGWAMKPREGVRQQTDGEATSKPAPVPGAASEAPHP